MKHLIGSIGLAFVGMSIGYALGVSHLVAGAHIIIFYISILLYTD